MAMAERQLILLTLDGDYHIRDIRVVIDGDEDLATKRANANMKRRGLSIGGQEIVDVGNPTKSGRPRSWSGWQI